MNKFKAPLTMYLMVWIWLGLGIGGLIAGDDKWVIVGFVISAVYTVGISVITTLGKRERS